MTDSTVDWVYDEATATVRTTYAYTTELKESNGTSVDETMTALYRHQWLNTSDPVTDLSYPSVNGQMKLLAGSTFTTDLPFCGVLPALPDRGDYNPAELLAQVQAVAAETLPVGPTYENGKAMGRFAHLVHIADQIGATAERDHFLAELKSRLEDWFTVGGAQEYSYIDDWDVMTGYPSGYGADNQINDHHFHAAYAIMSAATVAQYDSTWAAQDHWGGMVNLLIKDANNWDRTDTRFPFLRSHDAYAGHSWAAGHGDFGDGNNQESSSESMNFATAAILWGEATGQTDIRDMGVFLHATETTAVEQYWFDVDDAVFPADYPHVAIGMVWGGKGVHSTWFGADPEFIHGINILPVHAGSLYLGHDPDYVLANYNEIVAENSGQPDIWQDVLWEYLALADPNLALSYYFADIDYEPFDGESRAHTMHWLYNLKKMGRVDTTILADIATYAVFRDTAGDLTYVAYNAGSTDRLVTFTDGFSFTVGSRELASHTTSSVDPATPVVLLLTDRTTGKSPLTIQFQGGQSFDPDGHPLTFAWDFGGLGTSTAADTSYTFTEVGDSWVHLTVTNSLALSSRDSVLVSVLPNGGPYLGYPVPVPGRIEAEDYDLGGEGIAFHDVDGNNIGMVYRPDEGVDLEGAAGGGLRHLLHHRGRMGRIHIPGDRDRILRFHPLPDDRPGFRQLHPVDRQRGYKRPGGRAVHRGVAVLDAVPGRQRAARPRYPCLAFRFRLGYRPERLAIQPELHRCGKSDTVEQRRWRRARRVRRCPELSQSVQSQDDDLLRLAERDDGRPPRLRRLRSAGGCVDRGSGRSTGAE